MAPVIKVKDLTQRIGKKTILDGVSLEVYSGECFGLFGAGGAGKTTLLHILAGIDRFKSGSVEVLGRDVRKSEVFKKELGLVTQKRSLFKDLNAYENLEFISALKNTGRENISEAVNRFELKDFLSETVDTLNDGIYQRLSLACAFLNAPRLLIADDLIHDIDPYSRHLILKELTKFIASGGACVWAFSRVEYCAAANRIGWLENGLLTMYSPQEAQELWDSRLRLIEQQSGEKDA